MLWTIQYSNIWSKITKLMRDLIYKLHFQIVEKQTPQAHYDSPTVDVVYYVECIYNRRYHLYFESQATGGYATTSVRNEVPFRSVSEFVK